MIEKWNDLPVCPHCGAADSDWSEGLTDIKHDGDQWETTCPFCEKEYTIMMSVSPEFCTMVTPNSPTTKSECPNGLLPDGPICPGCGKDRGPSGIDGGTWVHYPVK